MVDNLTLSYGQLLELSEEFHLILSKDKKILYVNQAVRKRFDKIENSNNIFETLGILNDHSEVSIDEFFKSDEVHELIVDLDIFGMSLIINWKIVSCNNTLILNGKDITSNNSEREKLIQALQKISEDHAQNYSGQLTNIQRVLAENVDKFKLISENVSDIVCLHEPNEARYLYVSPSCKEVTGYTPVEMEGRSPYNFFHPDMIKALEEDHRKKEAGETLNGVPSGPPPKLIYLFKTKDRGFRWMESHSRPIFDKKREVVLILSTSRDVHDREIAEKEKERYLNYYRTLGNNIPNGAVYMIDRDYNYLIAEGEEFEKWGRTNEYYVGKNARDIYSEEKFESLRFYFEKLFAGMSVSFNWEFNNQYYVFKGKPCIEQDGSIQSAILLIQNITDSKTQATHLETALNKLLISEQNLQRLNNDLKHKVKERTQKLEQLYEQRTNTFINLAHETKTPLTLINNYLEEYINKQETFNIELQIIKANIQRLTTDMINFFDLERFNKGLNVYDHDTVSDFSSILNSKLPLFKSLAAKKLIDILDDIQPDIFVKANPGGIERIINNLIENSIKYTNENGKIYISLCIAANKIIFSLSDNGIGIPDHLKHKVFEPYFQLSSTHKNNAGMGLGLSIVKKIIDDLHGEIKIISKNEGTDLTVTLTLYHYEEGEIIPEYKTSSDVNLYIVPDQVSDCITDSKKTYILIVEDNVTMLSYLVDKLKDKYNIYTAKNGYDALKKIDILTELELIISDVMMDSMGGFEFCKTVLANERFSHIPFIFLTAKATSDDEIKGLKLGAVDYIEKPFLISQLYYKIESILNNLKKQRLAVINSAYKSILSNQVLKRDALSEKEISQFNFQDNCKNYNLTTREIEIIQFIAEGQPYKLISDKLNISHRTVNKHVSNIFSKVGVINKVELIRRLEA